MIATFGVVALGFYFFRCSGSSEILSGLKGSWLYLVVFAGLWWLAKAALRYRIVGRVVMFACCLAAFVAIGYIVLHKAFFLLKFWWIVPATVVASLEWNARNSDWPLQKVSDSQWKRFLLYAVCIFFIAISEPTEMTFIYFQF